MSYNRSVLILALQSEGVVDEVIREALTKAELYLMKERILKGVCMDLDNAQERYGDIFGMGSFRKPARRAE
jgi:hypothetical protein